MSATPIIVLKFGSSVLTAGAALRDVVHEVHRWRRKGYAVVVVASALAGETERLFALGRSLHGGASASGHALAATVAGGEREASAFLALALERAGVLTRMLAPETLNLIAEGPPLDADPVSMDVGLLHDALREDAVVVVPGYAARDAQGRTVLLGRGGSDLSALFLAARLGARCRLVKDVDGVYERDPAEVGPAPARFEQLSYEDALRVAGPVVQEKTLRFAARHQLRFEVAALHGGVGTSIGTPASRLSQEAGASGRPLKVLVLGAGVVGGALLRLLFSDPLRFSVAGVVVRDVAKPRALPLDPSLLRAELPADFARSDVIVDVTDGGRATTPALRRALAAGVCVVSANKVSLVADGSALEEAARASGARLLQSAAVGGCAPVLERLRGVADGIVGVRGALNGTSNYVLEAWATGQPLDQALGSARQLGFAERDASWDLTGGDAADKLVLIARALGWRLHADEVAREAISEVRLAAVAPEDRLRLRQVATLEGATERGRVSARVALEALAPEDPLLASAGAENAVELQLVGGGRRLIRGQGAGGWATAESLFGDLAELSRTLAQGRERCTRGEECHAPG